MLPFAISPSCKDLPENIEVMWVYFGMCAASMQFEVIIVFLDWHFDFYHSLWHSIYMQPTLLWQLGRVSSIHCQHHVNSSSILCLHKLWLASDSMFRPVYLSFIISFHVSMEIHVTRIAYEVQDSFCHLFTISCLLRSTLLSLDRRLSRLVLFSFSRAMSCSLALLSDFTYNLFFTLSHFPILRACKQQIMEQNCQIVSQRNIKYIQKYIEILRNYYTQNY